MQLRLEFSLFFESDWHVNAGFGADGKADAVIERDPQGKPVINGTTLKGVFRDALYDLALNLGKDPDSVTDILGSPGCDSHWGFGAAVPQAKSLRESMVATGVRVDPRYRRAEDNKYFKRELGAAEVFTFSVIGTAGDDETALREVEWLVASAAYIQRLGGRRRRGNGSCSIRLTHPGEEKFHEALLDSFAKRYCGEADKKYAADKLETLKQGTITLPGRYDYKNQSHRYRIVLYTERPVIIAEKPEAGNVYQGQIVIPGSTVRGAFAEKTQPGDLQADRKHPGKYDEFKRLFILGALKFSHLNPLSENGIPFVQAPLGLQKKEDNIKDFTSVFQSLTDQKAFSSWISLENKRPGESESDKKTEAKKKNIASTEAHPHGRINPDLKRASDGDLYTYEAIASGRYYAGELYLADSNWQSIGELLRVNIGQLFELRIGKGHHRSYGRVMAIIVPMTEDEPPAWIHVPLEDRLKAASSNELYITLATDTIVQDTWGRFYGKFGEAPTDSDRSSGDSEPAAPWIADIFHMKPEEIRVESPDVETDREEKRPAQVVRTKFVESFDARSGLPRWRDKALIAGSTARLVFANGKRPSNDVLKRLETEGIGLRRSEGYGRVIFNHPAHTEWADFDKPVAIPQNLLNEVNLMSVPVAETQEAFTQRWKKTVNAKIQGLVSEPVCRSLARQLIECPTIDELTKTLKLEPAQKPDKSSYEEYKKAASIIVELLEQARNEGEHWRKAVILLAEALVNNREKA